VPDPRPVYAARPSARHDPYRALFDAIDEGFCVIEVLFADDGKAIDYRFLDANPAFERHAGVRDPVGRSVRDLVPGLEEHWFARYGRVATTRRPERFTDDAQSLENRTFDVFAFPVGTPEHNRVGVLFTDITARRRAEEALRHSEERARTILESITDAFFAVDRDWRFTYVNRQAERLLDRASGAMLGASIWDLFPGVLGSEFEGVYRRAMTEGVASAVTAFYPDHGRWYEVRAFPAPDGITVYFQDVTDATAAAAALRASEERYRTLFASIDEGFCVVEVLFNGDAPVDYRFLEANPAFERQTGLAHPVGKTAREVAPGLEAAWIGAYGRVATTGEPERFVGAAPSVGGRWFEVFAFRVGAPQQRQVAILFTDITARRAAEDALRAVADRDAYLVALGDALRPLEDPVAVQTEAARLLGERLGCGRVLYAEATVHAGDVVVHGDYCAPGVPSLAGGHRIGGYGPRLEAALRRGQVVASPDVGRDPNLTPAERAATAAIGVAAFLAVPVLRAGELAALLVVHETEPRMWTVDDAALVEETARRTWDAAERTRAEAGLRASERRFRTLIQRSADAIQLVRPDGTVLYSSDSLEAVLGYRPDEIEGRSVASFIHPEDAPAVAAWIAGVAAEPGAVASQEFRVRHKDGSWAWVETTIANHLATPSVEAIVGNFRNVTVRKELERQKDEFVAVATHELKTPVTSIKGYAQLLRNRFRRAGDEHSAALMETLDGQIDRLATLVGDLVDATKVEAGQLRLEPAPFALDDLIDETAAALQLTTDRHRIRREGRGGVEIVADRDRIGQVLTNLLSNAIKYSPEGGDVVVSAEAAVAPTPGDADSGEDAVTVCVRDRGIGIPAAEVERVFDRFYRIGGGHHSAPPGLGLGLYISAEIVRRHGGRIWAESAEGEGSTFCMRLPLRPPEPDASRTA
jgi:PAS domain S-box-containing protein